MQTSENIADLAAALSKAQGDIQPAKKDSENPHFKSKYADLASVWEACRAALSKNGVAVVQSPETDPQGNVCLTTTLMHSSGQWMRSTIACRPAKLDAQGIGSVTTYLKRYALASMVGVAADDDDGEGAMGRGTGDGGETVRPPRRSGKDEKDDGADKNDKGKKIVLETGDNNVETFPATKRGAMQFVERLESLAMSDYWYWEENKAAALKLAETIPELADRIKKIANGNPVTGG